MFSIAFGACGELTRIVVTLKTFVKGLVIPIDLFFLSVPHIGMTGRPLLVGRTVGALRFRWPPHRSMYLIM
jgi:hypothetical protein